MEDITNETYSNFLSSLIPKTHIQALDFIKNNPDYDGRGVKIAIWDTGIDPAAEGLQINTECKPKLTYMYDTSGCAEVDLCTEVVVGENRKIKLLSNREIEIPESTKIRNNKVRLGLKVASDIFPKTVITHLSKEYKENIWTKEFNKIMLHLTEKKKSVQAKKLKDMEAVYMSECLDIMEKSFEYIIPVFDCLLFHNEENYVACVDTSILDTNGTGPLFIMSSFQISREYSNFGGTTNLNYGFHITEDGSSLQIVTCSGSHGTHVASIAAAYFPDTPECNGIAPGAEIISIKISDTRIGSMETGISLSTAAHKTVELGCDIINMSFGEVSVQSNCGQICQLLKELVKKHGIIFCSSSGNNGPSLFTVGSPGGTTDMIFGISPLVFPDTELSNYSLPVPPDNNTDEKKNDEEKVKTTTNGESSECQYPIETAISAQVYTWASRGPSTDGSWGIHVSAPGSAITTVGKFQHRGIGLMNGSSMSSPNACGGISLLICAAKLQNKELSPWLIQLATANTALVIPTISRLAQGHGVLQVADAYEYMKNYWKMEQLRIKNSKVKGDPDYIGELLEASMPQMNLCRDLTEPVPQQKENEEVSNTKLSLMSPTTPIHKYRIKCTVAGGDRGIILREPYETNRLRHFSVQIIPDFDQLLVDHVSSVNVLLYINLRCKATWVICPRYFTLYNQERAMSIKIDPAQLNHDYPEHDKIDAPDCHGDSNSATGVYTTEILLYSMQHPQLGPLARIPITVFKPLPPHIDTENSLNFVNSFTDTKKVIRHFLATPAGANAIAMRLSPKTVVEGSGRVEVCMMSLYPNSNTLACEHSRSMTLDKKHGVSMTEHICYGLYSSVSSTVELTLAQYWSSHKPAELEYAIDYHGLTCSNTQIRMLSSDHHFKLVIESQLRTEEVCPSITLNYLVFPIKPYKEESIQLNQKILSIDGIMVLNLYYMFNVSKAGDVGVFCPALGSLLYDNDYISQLYQIFDSNDRLVATGDYKPEIYFFKLEKGEHYVKLQIRHYNLAQLERCKDLAIQVYFKQFGSISFDFSRSLIDVNSNKVTGSGKLNFLMSAGERKALYISYPGLKNVKQYNVGCYYSGTLSLYKNETLKKAVSYPFYFVFTNISNEPNTSNNSKVVKFIEDNNFVIQNFVNHKPHVIPDVISDGGVAKDPSTYSSLSQVCTKSGYRDKLTKFLLDWIVEISDEFDRVVVENLLKEVHDNILPLETPLSVLKAIYRYPLNTKKKWEFVETTAPYLIESWDTRDLADYFCAKCSNPRFTLTKQDKLKLERRQKDLMDVLCIYGIVLCERISAYKCLKKKLTPINNETDDEAVEEEGEDGEAKIEGTQLKEQKEIENNQNEDDKTLYENLNDLDIVKKELKKMEKKLNEIYVSLCRFVAPFECPFNSYSQKFFVTYAITYKHWGMLLKMLLKTYEDHPNIGTLKMIIQTLDNLGWTIFANHYRKLELLRHMSTFINNK